MAQTKKTASFEESMARLEEIVSVLEAGKVSLEESLKLYEEGIRLSGACRQTLDEAEAKIRVLRFGENGEVTEGELGGRGE